MDESAQFQKGDVIAAEENSNIDVGVKIMFTACNTSQPGCAGLTYFYNNSGQTVSFRVWFHSGGQSNFVLPNGTNHALQVQYGDQWSYAYGSNGVPVNNPRYWCNVG